MQPKYRSSSLAWLEKPDLKRLQASLNFGVGIFQPERNSEALSVASGKIAINPSAGSG